MVPIRCANGPSAARSFVQLASRCYTTSRASPPSSAPLEFLVPRCPAPRLPTATSAAARHYPRAGNLAIFQAPGSSIHSSYRRGFATSSLRSATACVLNPVKDDDGNDMTMEITPRAAKRLSQIMDKDSNPDLALRIQVESGGCHGFQYLMSLITIPGKDAQEWSTVVTEDDSIFQYVPEATDSTATAKAPKIVLDEPSLELLKGSKVDFISELIGSSFQIVDNPLATSSCGCGTSFDVKI